MPVQVQARPADESRIAPTKLSFQGKLVAPKQTPDALLKRLKGAQAELASMEQETVDVRSLKSFAKELVSSSLLQHKEVAVRGAVSCCIADVLRLFAPEAPYSPSELKEVFKFFLTVITSTLTDKGDGTQNADTVYLLDSLSSVKSIALIFELPNAEALMIDYFKRFLSIAKPDMSKNVEICLADILVHLIDEAETVPQDVLDLLLAVFTPKALKQRATGHRLAVEVCNATADRMQKELAKYFVEVITTAAQEEDADDQQKQFETAHLLIVELNRSVPALLTSVLPQFEEELRTESAPLRQMAISTVGRILSEKNENAREFPQKWPAVWKAFRERAKDKVPTVRISFIDAVRIPLARHVSLKDDLTEALDERFSDPDDRVRVAVVHMVGTLDFETLLHHVSRATLEKLSERALDKKSAVQAEALKAMGKIYDKAFPEIERRDASAMHQFGWIPESMMEAAFVNQSGLRAVGEAFESHVLPLPEKPEEEARWVNRLLVVLKHVSGRAKGPLFNFFNLDATRRGPFSVFLERCLAFNGGTIDKDQDSKLVKEALQWSIGRCAIQIGSEKAQSDLVTVAKMNDKRLFKLLATCMDPKEDLKTIIKARTEITKRLEGSHPELLHTISAFIRSSGFIFINRSAVPLLARRLQPGEVDYSATQQDASQSQGSEAVSRSASASTTFQDFKEVARQLLDRICRHCPAMLIPYTNEFIQATSTARDRVLSEISLQALAAILAENGEAEGFDKRFFDRCVRFTHQGTPLEAKYAARLLAVATNDADLIRVKPHKVSQMTRALALRALDQLLEPLAQNLPKASDQTLVCQLSALGQCAKYAPKLTENVADSVVRSLVTVILPRKWTGDENVAVANNPDWTSDEGILPWLQVKVLAISFLVKRCMASAKKVSAVDMVKPVMRLLLRTLAVDEQTQDDTPANHLARLRLAAATGLVKLARVPAYEQLLGHDFITLAFAVQDVCFGVRQRFLFKILQYLTQKRLPSRFTVVGFLSAVDPEPENRHLITSYVQSAIRVMPEEERYTYFDMAFTRLLHLLAHHPDFRRDASREELNDFVSYIDFYLNLLVTSENVGLYFHLASKLKTVRDKETTEATDNIYALSEFAEVLIKRKARNMGWTIDTYPGKVKLPSDIFSPLPNPEVRTQICAHQYLPQDVVQWLSEDNKAVKNKVPRAIRTDQPRKRKAGDGARQSHKKRRRSKRDDDESEEERDASSDSDSEDENEADDENGEVSEMEEEIDLSKEDLEGRSARLREKKAREIQARNERRRERLAQQGTTSSSAKEGKRATAQGDSSSTDDEHED
ncbi:Sister chromatid cohesion protein pds5 [Tilletia horrida]|uniref:Sister chromatid cohesion protein pds5 n=1 Tax=Tilletia horrida TaxID=155126 RepID=A0AAN6GSR9_9BASI|nr:Sister chromatid cohesion protein pds5 [Tilletia horrida]KAK0568769.1 Sister chromatid cohesion protein pds5 [Tilletia horrida]